jgi:AraC-like DNA-binding protein
LNCSMASCFDEIVIVLRASAQLAPYVEKLWYCDQYRGVHRTERALPNARFQLGISLEEGPISALSDPIRNGSEIAPSLVLGIRSRFSFIDTAKLGSSIGVVFRPGGVRAFFDSTADAFCNKNVPLDLIWGSFAGSLTDQLRTAKTPPEKFRILERALLGRMKERTPLSVVVRYALEELERRPEIPSIQTIAREAGVSRRRFAQLFREQIGLTPKVYCRVKRFQNALNHIASGGPVGLAQVALTAGYCDQAHLAHEFREFSGLSLSTYLVSERRSAKGIFIVQNQEDEPITSHFYKTAR